MPKPMTSRQWDARWAEHDFAPAWLHPGVPADLDAALARSALASGLRILDLGCGNGGLALELAARGHDVTGIDFSATAIALAQSSAAKLAARPRFSCQDVCAGALAGEAFDLVIDRCCFDALEESSTGTYAAAVARLCRVGGRLLLVQRVGKGARAPEHKAQRKLRAIRAAFDAHFDVIDVCEAAIDREQSRAPDAALWALAVELRRNASAAPALPPLPSTRQRDKWQRTWADPDFRPAWQPKQLPEELHAAIAEQWFPRGATLLDVGCGSGQLAAWLADCELHVTGVDIAPAAIERARRVHGATPHGPRFEVADMCGPLPALGQFQLLVDRGCLHVIPEHDHAAYAANAAALTAPSGRFLLLYAVDKRRNPDAGAEETLRRRALAHLREVFTDRFDIDRVAPAVLPRAFDDTEAHDVPAIALWMTRKPSA
jgi:2-polyprenyl-3-methyl-5-hydroxy-6-metoxy-1,4-benzoquinol methylase